MLPRAWWIPFSLLALAAASIAACSADADENEFGATNSGGAGSGDPGGTNSGGESVSIGVANGGSTGANVGGGCVGTGNTAQKVPLDLFVMLDQSGSMSDNNKWGTVTGALTTFVNQPETAGIGMGLQYFGLGGAAGCPMIPFCTSDVECGACGPCLLIGGIGICEGATAADSCNAADYATAEVPIQPLPGVAPAIIASLGQHGPSTGTPTLPALQGAVTFATNWANQNPSHVTVVVFATDGIPEACDTTQSTIEAAAAAGFNGVPSIRTFVIGVGNSLGVLNGIAAAGGTGQAFLIDANANAQDAFVQALNEIQGAALPCAYVIPDPPDGESLDFGQVNVEYTPGGGGMPEIIAQVDGEASCGPAGGWYYDNPANPAQILLCPTTCEVVAGDTEGNVEVILGCATKIE